MTVDKKRLEELTKEIINKLVKHGIVNVQLDDSPESYRVYQLITSADSAKLLIGNNPFADYEFEIVTKSAHYDFDLISVDKPSVVA